MTLEDYYMIEIAGNNNTLSKALNIMEWLSENTYYCGSSPFGADTTENILEYSFGKGFEKAINCVNKAIVLSDFLMSINISALPIWITNEVKLTWYIHAFSEDQLYVVLKGKCFLISPYRDDTWNSMIEYGVDIAKVERSFLENIPLHI